jgi:predicted PurR-regulated permease PerM
LIGLLPSPLGIASGATVLAGTILGVIASILIVIFFGIYFALTPELYVNLVLRFAPADRRAEFRSVLEEIGAVLHSWLGGQLLAMTLVAVAAYLGLCFWTCRSLSCLRCCSECSSSSPISVRSSAQRPWAQDRGWNILMWVIALYLVVQLLESYALTPLIQSRAVSLPPAVVILSQLVFGAMFGVLGLALATPLVAAASVPMRRYLGADIRS